MIDQGVMSDQFHYLKSATKVSECPQDEFPEIAVLGRSNAGKSSLINAWTGARIAKVSSTAGKTRLINFFQGAKYRLVDFPGYGYAARSTDERRSWQKMIETFLSSRKNLVGCVLVMDCRRMWADEERLLIQFLQHIGSEAVVALTKIDKLNRSELLSVKKEFQGVSGLKGVFYVSSLKKTGVRDLEEGVYKLWLK